MKHSNQSHLENQYQLNQRAILIEFYGELTALGALSEKLNDYDPKTTNERMEIIISDTLNKLKGLEYENGAIQDSRDDRIQPF